MADDDYTVKARLVVDVDDARKFEQAASRIEASSRRMTRSSRDVATTSGSESRRAASAWEGAAQRMGSSSNRAGRDADSGARRAGNAWNTAGRQIQSSAARAASGASAAGGAISSLGSRSSSAASGMLKGASGAASFAGKLLMIVGAAGSAAAALAAIPAAGAAIGGMFGVIKASFSGVGAALKGYESDQKSAAKAAAGGGGAASSNARAIRDAYKQIADAQKQQTRTARDGAEAVEAAAERVEDAKRSEARAYRDVEDAIKDQARVARDSEESIAAAQKRHQEAIKDVTRAEVDLDTARKDALRTMDDLKERVSDLALDQEGAAIAVAEAEKAYYREMESSTATTLSRRKALYDLNVAKERQSDLDKEATQAVQENDEAQRRGIEGSEGVIAAKERLASAQDAERESSRDEERAREDAARANEESARRVSDAQESAAASTRDREGAERDFTRAQRDASEANADAAERVADAMQGLKDAQDSAAESAGGGASKFSEYQDALKKLGPEGKDFVKKLLEMKEKLDDLKKSVAAKFLPGVTQMLEDSKVLFPIFDRGLGKIGETMGNTARKFGELFKNKDFQANLEQMFTNAVPIVEKLGTGAVKLLDAFVKLGANKEISEGLGHLVDGILTGLLGLLDKINANGGSFGTILKKWGDAFAVILPIAGDLIGWLAKIDPIVAIAAGAFLFLGTKAGPLVQTIGGIIGIIKKLGGASKENEGKVRGFGDAVSRLRGGGGDGGGSGGGSGGGRGGGGRGGRGGNSRGGRNRGGSSGGGGRSRGGGGGGGRRSARGGGGGGDEEEGGGGMDAVGEIWDGFENGSDGDWMSWGDDIGAGIHSLGEQLGLLSPKVDEASGKINGFKSTVTSALGPLPSIGSVAFGGLKTEAENHLQATGAATVTHSQGILGNLSGALGLVPGIGDKNFGDLLTTAGGWLGGLVDDAGRFAGAATGNVDGGLSGLPGVSNNWFSRMVAGAADQGTNLVRWALGVPGQVVGALGNLGTTLWNSGSSLVQGFLNGIIGNWDRLTSWVRQGMTQLRGLWPFSPAKTGPFSGRGYVTYSGAALTGDFAASLREGTPNIIASARAAMDAAHGEFGRGLAMTSNVLAAVPVSSAVTRGGSQVVAQVVNHNYHVAGSLWSEQELVETVQKRTSRHAGRNTNNGLTGRD